MRFKLGLAIGFVAGFVVGARAGKERYEKLVARIRATLASDRMHQATDLAERATRRPRASAGSGLVDLAEGIRERANQPRAS
jgi:hypothetical protein